MAETKWTPGPWTFYTDLERTGNTYISERTGGGHIAKMWRDRSCEQANAHLIAAAPEMAQELTRYCNLLRMLLREADLSNEQVRMLENAEADAEAILAKARGEA